MVLLEKGRRWWGYFCFFLVVLVVAIVDVVGGPRKHNHIINTPLKEYRAAHGTT